MTGGPQRDESLSFSLEELKQLEEQRITQEREAREAREKAAKLARDEADRRARAELEARELAANEARERARFREMEEEARREAIQRAAVEQTRITVEARTRTEEADRERRHEIELQRLRAETTTRPGPGGLVASALGGAALVVGLSLVVHFAVSRPAAERRIGELDRAVAGADSRADELGRRVEDQKLRIAQLEKSLGEAQAELTRRPAAPPPKPPGQSGQRQPGPKAAGHGSSKPNLTHANDGPPCADRFDPLCGHIDTH